MRALYNHTSSGDSQLTFLTDDIIVLYGDKKDGWHYGHNTRTKQWVCLIALAVHADTKFNLIDKMDIKISQQKDVVYGSCPLPVGTNQQELVIHCGNIFD